MKALCESENTVDFESVVGQSGLVVMKTCSQMGDNKVFKSFEKYVEHVQSSGEAHKIIKVDELESLIGQPVVITLGMFGTQKLGIEDFEMTITEFHKRYRH